MKSLGRQRSFDLTTRDGLAEAAKEGGLDYLVFVATGPIGLGAYALYRYLSLDTEVKAAQDLIAQGRRDGLREMRIKLSKKAAAGLGQTVDGLPIRAEFDFGNSVEISVVYQ